MSSPRAVLWRFAVVLAACGGKPDDGPDGDAGTMPATGAGTTAESSAGTTAPTTTQGSDDGAIDVCEGRPGGDWNACKKDGNTQNSLCDWTMGGAGTLSCLVPASGGYNVCGINHCEDDCDCFAPPLTGTALATCTPVFANGGKACVLYCVNGQTCPDGMTCVSGTCYWPD